MPIQIVKAGERLTHKDAGSKIYYRRIPSLTRGAIVKKHTHKGKTDWNAVTADILDYILLGWDAVQEEGTDIPYDKETAKSLPEDVLSDLMALSGGNGAESTEKN